MQTIVKISLLALCVGLVSAELKASDMSLMQFMVRSRDLSQQNPTRSMACFDYYVPVLNGITEQYEVNYAACLKSAAASKEELDESTYPERKEIEGSAQSSCDLLSGCNANEDSITYFECYANAGSENTKTMYTISANASEILVSLREKHRLIENEQDRCTTASERAYVEDTTVAYDQLQGCLQGKTPVPTTTAAPITEPATTEEPATTTEEPVPTTTSTDAPTTEPATIEPTTEDSIFNDKMPEEDLYRASRTRIAEGLEKFRKNLRRN